MKEVTKLIKNNNNVPIEQLVNVEDNKFEIFERLIKYDRRTMFTKALKYFNISKQEDIRVIVRRLAKYDKPWINWIDFKLPIFYFMHKWFTKLFVKYNCSNLFLAIAKHLSPHCKDVIEFYNFLEKVVDNNMEYINMITYDDNIASYLLDNIDRIISNNHNVIIKYILQHNSNILNDKNILKKIVVKTNINLFSIVSPDNIQLTMHDLEEIVLNGLTLMKLKCYMFDKYIPTFIHLLCKYKNTYLLEHFPVSFNLQRDFDIMLDDIDLLCIIVSKFGYNYQHNIPELQSKYNENVVKKYLKHLYALKVERGVKNTKTKYKIQLKATSRKSCWVSAKNFTYINTLLNVSQPFNSILCISEYVKKRIVFDEFVQNIIINRNLRYVCRLL